jgi:hypothetical protein
MNSSWLDDAEVKTVNQKVLDAQVEAKAKIENEVDRIINKTATDLDYKSIDAIAKYQGRNGPFSAQCEAMAVWVDGCYVTCFQIQDEVIAGIRVMPTIEEVAGLLPIFIDPGVTL